MHLCRSLNETTNVKRDKSSQQKTKNCVFKNENTKTQNGKKVESENLLSLERRY